MDSLWQTKKVYLFLILGSFFIANAIIAEFIGVKIFSLEQTLGITNFGFSFFGQGPFSLNLTAGVLLWPFVFVMTDIINEYFGRRGVRFFSYLAVVLIGYAFFAVFAAVRVSPADFWVMQPTNPYQPKEMMNMQMAFSKIFGQGMWIIVGSLVAFLVGQLVDVAVFHRIKQISGDGMVWFRSTGSTLVSQFLDSFVVLFIAFYLGSDWSLSLVLAVGMVNYGYKFVVALLMTPLIYVAHYAIDRYLGEALSSQMKQEAMGRLAPKREEFLQ